MHRQVLLRYLRPGNTDGPAQECGILGKPTRLPPPPRRQDRAQHPVCARSCAGEQRSPPSRWSAGRMPETQFKPGARPHTWKPIGSTRVTNDGYLQRKISDTGYPPRDWVGVHILLWEEAHGPIPKGHALIFKDRNKGNLCLENFELITRAELMRRNTIHNYPPELVDVIRLGGALKRRLRRIGEEQAIGPAQPPV
jgi:hypothetical protein